MLLVPYVLWSLVIFVGRSAEGATDSLVGYVDQLLMGQAAEPYYYIPLITQLYLLAPFLVGAFKRYPKSTALAAATIQVGVQGAGYPAILGADSVWLVWMGQAPGWFFPHMIFWFVLGGAAGFHQREFNEWLTEWRLVLPWVTVALGAASIVEWELLLAWSGREWLAPRPTVLDTFYSLSFVLTFLALTSARQVASPKLNELGVRSFGIYLIHAPVLELFSRGAYHLVPMLLGHQFLFMCSLVVVGIGVPLALMTLVNRTPARPCYNYLFG